MMESGSGTSLVVGAAVAPLLAEPRIAASLISQLLAGHVAHVLDRRGPWHQVRGTDGYVGWTHEGYLAASSGGEETWRISLGCTVALADGRQVPLPLGARLTPDHELRRGRVVHAADRARAFPSDAVAIAATAATLFEGAAYLWGGVTPWGTDCSGFVQSVFALHGVPLPRDAWQQAECGHAVAPGDAMPGDLAFFSDRDDRRVTHVGIMLSGRRMVHSALMRGGVAIEQLPPQWTEADGGERSERDVSDYPTSLLTMRTDTRRILQDRVV